MENSIDILIVLRAILAKLEEMHEDMLTSPTNAFDQPLQRTRREQIEWDAGAPARKIADIKKKAAERVADAARDAARDAATAAGVSDRDVYNAGEAAWYTTYRATMAQ